MAIIFDCVCGKEIQALDAQAGHKVLCPVCRSDLTVPPRSTAVRPEVIPDLGVFIGEPIQLSTRPSRSRVRTSSRRRNQVDPMNAVGLFSLLCSVASYLLTLLCYIVFAMSISDPAMPLALPVWVCSFIAMALAGLAALVARLGRQKVVDPFWLIAISAAAPPFLLSSYFLAGLSNPQSSEPILRPVATVPPKPFKSLGPKMIVHWGSQSFHVWTRSKLDVVTIIPELPPNPDHEFHIGDPVVLIDASKSGLPNKCFPVLFSDLAGLRLAGSIEKVSPSSSDEAGRRWNKMETLQANETMFAVPPGSVATVVDITDTFNPIRRWSVKVRLKPSGEEAWVFHSELR
jgi:hypothetical protein